MRIYIAGPMRGIPEFNFPAFDQAAERLRLTKSYTVINPAEHDRENGFDPVGMTGNEDLVQHGFDLRAALAWDLEQVAQADAIYLLKGWQNSKGARAEYALARALDLKVVADGGTPIWMSTTVFEERGFAPDATPAATAGEVRVTSNTGGQKGSKPERFDLIPDGPLRTLAALYGKGAEKYEDRNWERGYDWSLSFAALNRHLWQFWGGQDHDTETGLPHLASVAWHAFALLEFMERHPDYDNRPGKDDVVQQTMNEHESTKWGVDPGPRSDPFVSVVARAQAAFKDLDASQPYVVHRVPRVGRSDYPAFDADTIYPLRTEPNTVVTEPVYADPQGETVVRGTE